MNLAQLFSHETNPLILAAGEVLFKEREIGDAMFVVLDGSLDIVVGNTAIGKATRGDMLGEMAIIDQSPRSATIVAREPTRLARLDSKQFHRLIQQHPFFATHLMKVLAERIRYKDQVFAQNQDA